jgi:hypothetical protein
MALWDFLGGAADQGVKILDEKRVRDADRKEELDREKRKEELEKNRIVSIQYGKGQGGQLMAQPVNAAGEPVGQPRAANNVEQERYNNGEKERTLKIRESEAGIGQANAAADYSRANTASIPQKMKIEQQQANAYSTQAGASATSAGVNAELTRENTRRTRMENDSLEQWIGGNKGKLPPDLDHRPVQPRVGDVPKPQSESQIQEEIISIADELEVDGGLTPEEEEILNRYETEPAKLLQILRQLQRDRKLKSNVETSSDNTINSLDALIARGR